MALATWIASSADIRHAERVGPQTSRYVALPCAQQDLRRELIEPFVPQPLRGDGVHVEGRVLEGLRGLAAIGGRGLWPRGATALDLREQGLDLWIGVPLPCLLLQNLVGPHTARGEGPHALLVLRAQGVSVEVLGPVVAGVLEQLDQEEGVAWVGLPEAQVLVEATRQLVVEVD